MFSSESEISSATEGDQARIPIILADHDPLSRQALANLLCQSAQLDVIACVDSHDPLEKWPLKHARVTVLAVSPNEPMGEMARRLVARAATVLLIGMDFTRHTLDAAFGAGVAGCLVRDAELSGLASAVQAVASGHVVLSPDALRAYVPRETRNLACTGRALGSLTERERQILVLLADGVSTAEAAKVCGVSTATIKSHVSHALIKLGARNRLQAVLLVKDALDSLPAR